MYVVVSSDFPQHSIEVTDAVRDDFDLLRAVWESSNDILHHSRGPGVICGNADVRKAKIWKLFDDQNNLVAYFPYETKRWCGINILEPYLSELTLDFIDLSVSPEWKEYAYQIFCDWIITQPKTVVYFFMLSEESALVKAALEEQLFRVEPRGTYFNIDLPDSLDSFIHALGKSTRSKMRRALKKHEETARFEVVTSQALGDEVNECFDDLVRLHLKLFPTGSLMIPHKEELFNYISIASKDDSWVFFRAREISTGEVIANELYMLSPRAVGLYQGGRSVDPQHSNIGNWMLLKCIEWAIENGKERFEFLFGDQDYKKRLATEQLDAVSITYFSSQRARYTFRIRQRLGRYIPALR